MPCDQPEITTWNLIKLSTDNTKSNKGIYLWAPRRLDDPTTPVDEDPTTSPAVPPPRLSPATHACTMTTAPPP